MATIDEKPPPMHVVIHSDGVKEPGACGCCGGWNLYRVDEDWVACSWCDVDEKNRWR